MDTWFNLKGASAFDLRPRWVDPDEWQDYRMRHHQAEAFVDNGYPIQIDLELNSGCNMKCPFCIHGYEDIANEKMSLNRAFQVIDEGYALGARSLKLNYINEPLLRKDLEEVILYAGNTGYLNIYFVTNGTALTEKRAKSLLDTHLTKLFVSIDATSADVYSEQRLDGRFERVRENVKRFIELRNERRRRHPIVCVSFLRNQINQHQESEFIEEWAGVADVVNIQKMNEVPDRDTGLTMPTIDEPDIACKFPFKQLVVESTGRILPCCKLYGKKIPLGKVHKGCDNLEAAWKRAAFLRKQHSDGSWRKNPVCAKCMECG